MANGNREWRFWTTTDIVDEADNSAYEGADANSQWMEVPDDTT